MLVQPTNRSQFDLHHLLIIKVTITNYELGTTRVSVAATWCAMDIERKSESESGGGLSGFGVGPESLGMNCTNPKMVNKMSDEVFGYTDDCGRWIVFDRDSSNVVAESPDDCEIIS